MRGGDGVLGRVPGAVVRRAHRYRFYPDEAQAAFTNFFGERAAYPRFKSRKNSRASAEYTRSGFRWRDGELTLAIVWSRASLPTLSTGEKITNPRRERRERVARVKVARMADRRRDLLHKLTTRLVRENQTIVIEDLAVGTTVRNHNLARAISDASWSQFRSTLTYKAEWYGRTVAVVDRWCPSSKTCSHCGHLLDTLPLHLRQWTCPGCGEVHDRDGNAAKNILAAGRAVVACGDGVRPNRHESVGHLSEPPFRGAGTGTVRCEADGHSPVLLDRGGRQAVLPPESG